MMKFLNSILLSLSLLTFWACQPDSNKQETNLIVSQNFSLGSLNGGFVLIGIKQNPFETIKLIFKPGEFEKKISLTKGQWIFRAAGWTGTAFQNTLQCGRQLIEVTTSTSLINLNLTTNCDFQDPTGIRVKKFLPILCSTSGGANQTQFNYCQTAYQSIYSYFKIEIESDDELDSIESGCYSLSPSAAASLPKVPHINGLKTKLKFFSDINCSSSSQDIVFKNGIGNSPEVFTSYRIQPVGDTEGIVLPRIELASTFDDSAFFSLSPSFETDVSLNISNTLNQDNDSDLLLMDKFYLYRDFSLTSSSVSFKASRDPLTCIIPDGWQTLGMIHQHNYHVELKFNPMTNERKVLARHLYFPTEKMEQSLGSTQVTNIRASWDETNKNVVTFNANSVYIVSYNNSGSVTQVNLKDENSNPISFTNIVDAGLSNDSNYLVISLNNSGSYSLKIFKLTPGTSSYVLKKDYSDPTLATWPIKYPALELNGVTLKIRFVMDSQISGQASKFKVIDLDTSTYAISSPLEQTVPGSNATILTHYYRDNINQKNYFRVTGNSTLTVHDDVTKLTQNSWTSASGDGQFYALLNPGTFTHNGKSYTVKNAIKNNLNRLYIHNNGSKNIRVLQKDDLSTTFPQPPTVSGQHSSSQCQVSFDYKPGLSGISLALFFFNVVIP